jgi:hypothetical protein
VIFIRNGVVLYIASFSLAQPFTAGNAKKGIRIEASLRRLYYHFGLGNPQA